MRKIIVAITIILLIAVTAFFIKAANGGFEKEMIPAAKTPAGDWKDINGPLISTFWKQDGYYAEFSPGRNLLGCWSVAFAQVLGYHRLQPSGNTSYVTSGGYSVIEEFKDPVRWEEISDSIRADGRGNETARYCYNAAVVVRKDFGTGEYIDVSIIPDEIGIHYGCKVQKTESDIPAKLVTEISAGRPVVVYFNDILSIKLVRNGHAAVIDGTATRSENLMVHVNLGWGGGSDGWYDYNSLVSERRLQYIFTVHPL